MMRKIGLIAGISAGTLIGSGAAWADADFLSSIGAVPAGELSGRPIYSLPSQSMVFMRLPDGNVFAGYAFDAAGEDISSMVTGSTPVSIWDSLRIFRPDPGQGQGAGLIAQDTRPPAAIIPPPTAMGEDLISDTMAMKELALEGRSVEEKNRMTLELVEAMDGATNPIDFRLKVIEWTERATGQIALDDEVRALMKAESAKLDALSGAVTQPAQPSHRVEEHQAAEAKVTAVPTPYAKARQWVEYDAPDSEGIVLPTITLAPGTTAGADNIGQLDLDIDLQAGSDGAMLLGEMENKANWIEIGAQDAPVVYMFADPMCPYCAKSFQNLQGDVEGGAIRLRVILAPLVSSRAGDMIAGILSSEDPADALWRHELQYALNGASDVRPVDFASLSKADSDEIRANYDLIMKHNLRGVPFFGWQGDEGAKFLSGVPHQGYFDGKFAAD